MNPIQSELSRLRAENAELLAALRDVMAPYSIYDAAVAKAVGVAIIDQFCATGEKCRDAITKAEIARAVDDTRMADILRNSLPVAVEPAPPVPQRLADEISAAHLRATPAAHPPRFFRDTSTGMTWEFRNGKMTTDGEDSIFKSPAEILECLDVLEVDEFGDVLELTASDIAAEKSDQSRE